MTIFVRSGATGGTYDGTSWATAFQSLATPLATAPTSQTAIWVSEDHSESLSAATTLAAGLTQANITNILCVNHTTGALASGAIVATANGINLTLTGVAYSNGIAFTSGAGSTATASILYGGTATDWTFENCPLRLNNTSTASVFGAGAAALVNYRMTLINSPMTFGNVSQTIRVFGALALRGAGTTFNGSIPTNLILLGGYNGLSLNAEAVDMSAFTLGSKYLYTPSPYYPVQVTLKDCKLAGLPSGPSGVSNLANGAMLPTSTINIIRSGPASGGNGFVEQKHTAEGVQVDETSITLSGGTTDGVTLKSRKLTTSALASMSRPHEGSTITVWNTNTANTMTVSFQGIWDASAVPNDNDFWIEVEYLANSGDSLGGFVSSNLSSAVQSGNALPVGSGTWANTTGMSAPKKFIVTTPAFTPAQSGFLTIRPKLGKASSTLYYDPKPIIAITGGVTFPAISRSLVLPSGALMHETQSTITNTVNQLLPIGGRRPRRA